MFNQIDLFTDALGLQKPWKVIDVSFNVNENQGGEISKVEHVSCDMSPAFISGN